MSDHHVPARPTITGAGAPTASTAFPVATTTATLLGQVMTLVAVALGFLTIGSFLGRELSNGVGLLCSFGAFGMLLVQAFGGTRFRTGDLAIGWLFAIALVLGLGLGRVLMYYASMQPGVITQAALTTALVVAAMAGIGLLVGRDLVGWLRPLTFVVLGLVLASLVLALLGDAGHPLISLAIGGVSALLLVVDFNYLRKHGTEDDVVLLATGIFVSIVNIFLSLLDLFSRD
ncbi:MAG TPA: Bax inhibitor-1 family protein [Aquihabitans sp.]|jgi:FtsH-binding integral membrane protein|nr:Bax inhibitor-1 family protein [Aquihabitans sp.]